MSVKERLLPQSIEAEQGVLGSIIIDPDALATIADGLSSDDFYRDAHRTLYQVMMSLYERHEGADFITICDELERMNKLQDVGGPSYVTSLINQVPTSGNVTYYARIVKEKATFRRLIHAAGQIAAHAYEESSDAVDVAEQLVLALHPARTRTEVRAVQEVVATCMDELRVIYEQQGQIIGLPTGFRHLDIPLGGFQRADLIVLAARPGTGKTSFALNVALHVAHTRPYHVAFFSLEMGYKQLGVRLLSMQSRIDQQRLRTGWVHDAEWDQLIGAVSTLSDGQLWIDDTAGLSITALRSRARRLQAQLGIDLVIVDYLQLLHATQEGKRYPNREQEIAEISRGLKGLAKELNVPVLALAQLSRAVESRQSKIPQLSDLRESGAIENDADVVLFIYRDELYNPETEAPKMADIIIAKHRNGPTGTIRLGFDATQTRFHDLEEG